MSAADQPVFKPFPFLAGCHLQTIAASLLVFSRDLPSTTRFVHLPDGDRIAFEVNTPPNWKPTDPTIVMVHGLCGSHRSSYIIRMAKKLEKRDLRTVRINLRGCGTGKGYAKRMYLADASNDVWHVLNEIKRDGADSPLVVMGFSLGGNIVLKMAGERGEEASKLISNVIAINPPMDLYASIRLLCKNKVYERYFMKYLRSEVLDRHRHFTDLPPIEIPSDMSLMEFDEFYLAPQSGYSSAKDYYHACSAGRLIPDIEVESHILFAKDDPIVDCNVLGNVKVPDNVDILITEHGGHLGFLGTPGEEGGFHWMDSTILQWIFNE